MLLGFLTILVMGIIAYAFWREGPLSGLVMCCNVFLAGLVAFNFWEPIADLLEPAFSGWFLEGTEDLLALMLVFCPMLALLRWATYTLASTHMEYPEVLYRGGAVFFGLLTGYLLAGFLTCAFQTLPFHQNFLGFEPYEPGKSHPARRYLPPDVVWLAMMHRLSAGSISGGEQGGFDPRANFELRYGRYRRFELGKDKPMKWQGEMRP
jgi:hypothetical protein